jgi:hypothetical protein
VDRLQDPQKESRSVRNAEQGANIWSGAKEGQGDNSDWNWNHRSVKKVNKPLCPLVLSGIFVSGLSGMRALSRFTFLPI